MKNSKFILKWLGTILEILGIAGAIIVPIVMGVILPIRKAYIFYSTGGTGGEMILKVILYSMIATPLLALVIFIPLFCGGAAIYTSCEESEKKENELNNLRMQQQMMMQAAQQQQAHDPRNDFYIVKEDNPNRSDAGIAQMNMLLKKKQEEESKENEDE